MHYRSAQLNIIGVAGCIIRLQDDIEVKFPGGWDFNGSEDSESIVAASGGWLQEEVAQMRAIYAILKQEPDDVPGSDLSPRSTKDESKMEPTKTLYDNLVTGIEIARGGVEVVRVVAPLAVRLVGFGVRGIVAGRSYPRLAPCPF